MRCNAILDTIKYFNIMPDFFEISNESNPQSVISNYIQKYQKYTNTSFFHSFPRLHNNSAISKALCASKTFIMFVKMFTN